MRATIGRTYTFDAAHQLTNVPEGHKCSRLHGHTYVLEVRVHGNVTNGFVMDFADIDRAVRPLIGTLDHRNLNDLFSFPTTAENLASWIYHELKPALPGLLSITLFETPRSWATYEGEKETVNETSSE